MDIKRNVAQPSSTGPAEYFTGNARVDPLFAPKDTAPFAGGYVTFAPGARSNWHMHPTGQHLIVTSGVGWTQERGRADRGDSRGRRRLVSAEREALARRDTDHRHDAHRPHGNGWRQERGVDGEGERRAVPETLGTQAAFHNLDITGLLHTDWKAMPSVGRGHSKAAFSCLASGA